MSTENGRPSFVFAEKLNVKNVLSAVFDSPILGARIHFGRVETDGKTIKTPRGHVAADSVNARPGDKVVTHEVS